MSDRFEVNHGGIAELLVSEGVKAESSAGP
jgi:hypothetical protein